MLRDRRVWLVVGATAIAALAIGLIIGRVTAAGPGPQAVTDSTSISATIGPTAHEAPQYGDDAARASFIAAAGSSLPAGVSLDDDALLAAGDSLCADLEGFTNQGRDAHYAIRILWTDELRYLDSTEVALYGTVLAAAPAYLCPESRVLAEDIAYWLGV